MKRIIASVLTVILLSLCLGFVSSAYSTDATFSEDFRHMYLHDSEFTRVDGSMLELNGNSVTQTVALTPQQKETIKSISVEAHVYYHYAYVDINYKDGSTLSVFFLNDAYADTYNELINGDYDRYMIDFEWPENNTVVAKKDALTGEEVTLTGAKLMSLDYYMIRAVDEEGVLAVLKGALLIGNNEYYYVDFDAINISNASSFIPYDYSELTVKQLTDEELLIDIKAAEEKYYSDDFGFLFNDEFTENVSKAFIIFTLIVLPLLILVLFLIFAIRSKGFYRKLYITVCALAGTELIVIGIIYAIIKMFA